MIQITWKLHHTPLHVLRRSRESNDGAIITKNIGFIHSILEIRFWDTQHTGQFPTKIPIQHSCIRHASPKQQRLTQSAWRAAGGSTGGRSEGAWSVDGVGRVSLAIGHHCPRRPARCGRSEVMSEVRGHRGHRPQANGCKGHQMRTDKTVSTKMHPSQVVGSCDDSSCLGQTWVWLNFI